MPQMTLNRNYVLRSTRGHAIQFEKDVPVHVPPVMVPEAIGIGAQPLDSGSVDPPPEEGGVLNTGPTDPEERKKQVFAVFRKLARANVRDDFTAGGVPQLAALSRELGWSMDTKERGALWQKYRDEGHG